MPGPRKSKQCCARRSPGDALKDAGSIPATSTEPENAPDPHRVRGVLMPFHAACPAPPAVIAATVAGTGGAPEPRPEQKDHRQPRPQGPAGRPTLGGPGP